MGKNRRPSVELVRKWIEQGDGQGVGQNYRPFFHVRDVPSTGRSTMTQGLKTGRVHHYFSDVEFHHHILAEYSPDVVDIREQYALLPWDETQVIAEELGFLHPRYPGTNTPIVMTSDIVMTERSGSLAVLSIKRASHLENSRIRERMLQKLYIERVYWQRRNINWRLSTENNISLVRARNLANLRTSMVSRELDSVNDHLDAFIHLFTELWDPTKLLHAILKELAIILRLTDAQCFCLFGRALWLRRLRVNLDIPIDHFSPVMLIRTNGGTQC